MVKLQPSLESARPSTCVYRDGTEMGGVGGRRKSSMADDRLFAQHGYIPDDDTKVDHDHEDSDTDVEARRGDNGHDHDHDHVDEEKGERKGSWPV